MPSFLLLLPIGFATGTLSGLFGVGGGFVLVPLLLLLGWPLHLAIGTSLFYVTLISVLGGLSHYRRGNLDGRLVLTIALPAMVGALGGALLGERLPAWFLDLVFAGLVAFAAWQLHHRARVQVAEPDQPAPIARGIALGTGVGVLSGLLGVGGGVLLVPGQTAWLHIPLRRAIGNSLVAVILTGMAGACTHLALGNLDWRDGLVLTAGGVLGLQLGLRILHRISAERLHGWFLAFMVVMALFMAGRGVVALAPLTGFRT
jgi:hypothetical protein